MEIKRTKWHINFDVGILELGARRGKKQSMNMIAKETGCFSSGSNLTNSIRTGRMKDKPLHTLCQLLWMNFNEMVVLRAELNLKRNENSK